MALSDPGADELDELAAAFGVRWLALDRTPEGAQRPKLEHHGESTILTVKTVRADASTTQLEVGAVDIFVGARYAVAVGQSSPDALEGASCAASTRVTSPLLREHPQMQGQRAGFAARHSLAQHRVAVWLRPSGAQRARLL